MKVRKVGFFRELSYGNRQGPSLKEAIRLGIDYDKRALVKYLNSAPLFDWAPGLGEGDVINPTAHFHDPLTMMTDGVWVWPGALAYYVEMYNVELPLEFLEYVKRMAFTPPDEKDLALTDLEW